MSDPSATSEWMVWANRLSEALEHQRFTVYLQGVYDANTRELRHHEALVRMLNADDPQHPFQPNDFIGHAENSGKILALDRWMITTCIQQLATLPDHAPIAVNISARTLVDARLPDFVRSELDRMGVSPQSLQLELTETSAVSRFELAEQGVRQLQALGCQVSLDDFGSGFTSIAYLKQLHADCVKIDGQFILRLATERENQILLRAIVDIAHASGKRVVAEWIEDEASLELVKSFGVDLVQGYLFGHPVPMEHPST
jgi:EAL domain-containing protein (putative c-di-GMP-specific phosphodiesterase class I)